MMKSFTRLYNKYITTKDALIKSQGFSIHYSKKQQYITNDDNNNEVLPEIAAGISIETVNEVIIIFIYYFNTV